MGRHERMAALQRSQQRPVTAAEPEIMVETSWACLLDDEVPSTSFELLGAAGSQYDMRVASPKQQQKEQKKQKQNEKKTAAGADPREWGAILLRGMFSEQECKKLIEAAESHGFGYTDYPKYYRGNTRLIVTDQSLTDAMWSRVSPFVPKTLEMCGEVWDAVGLNERWRLAKYVPGDRFRGHVDASYETDCGRLLSMYTVNIYMNGEFTGGATRFYGGQDEDGRQVDFSVKGEAGMCCLFRQPPGALYFHDGEQLYSGEKYLFRSDVMYRRRPTAAEAEASVAAPAVPAEPVVYVAEQTVEAQFDNGCWYPATVM